MPLKYEDILKKTNDLWKVLGDGQTLTLGLDGSLLAVQHPHGVAATFSVTRGDLGMTIEQFAAAKLTPTLRVLKGMVD